MRASAQPRSSIFGKIWAALFSRKAPFPDPTHPALPSAFHRATRTSNTQVVEYAKQKYTDADSYTVELPADDVTSKALVLSAALLNDYLYHESGGDWCSQFCCGEGAPPNQEMAR